MGFLSVFDNLLYGLGVALTPVNMLVAVVGLVLGTAIGVLPGLGGTNGVALLLPLTFTLTPTSAIILLASVYWGAIFGGAITSILFNIPGEPWSVATTFDGHPLAKQGKPGIALTAAFTSSFIGALVSIILFTFFAPPLAELALRFGPPENFAVLLLAFATFAGLGGGDLLKTVLMTLLGLLLSTVGFDIVSGRPRMNFGFVELQSGINFVVIAIGLFGLGEILLTVEEGLRIEGVRGRISFRDLWETWKLFPRYVATLVRATILGFWIGVLPGTGATPASFMSYGLAKQFSAHPERFGKGEVEGVVAPETAAHAAGIGALLPMVTLGIPGSPTAAVMLAGFFIWGLNPGPLLFTEQREFVWGLIGSMYIANVVGVVLVLTLVPVFAAINRIPFGILAPLIVILSSIGAYAANNQILDLWIMLASGVAGYLFKKLRYPLAPLVVALVLGDMTEQALRQSLIMGQGHVGFFLTRPIALAFIAASAVLFLLPVLRGFRRRPARGAPRPVEAA
ncbi:MAG: tripartite tricarboxylate transporter permease [Armatimonadota bacterium]|nr:tripartite tricarboxylate transporter permease [Armatimonadota bacterium]MDR7401986.1 tripartite tricarboxylate transporter permease [Armatimonadota bacterium]MDR7403948.1 tripartite tricarboxylate transporter permease [Armatimonadota bacterium]MDR7438096.1 tripartite tricarboxylate transporter permease [Armatimonadota bacterium]MDR7471464.1 tripartite tricarboxylate transporter permease [Armatimonadota bacterium]